MTTHTESRAKGLGTGFRIAALIAFAVLIALGVWQVKRLHWKLDLIARVDARANSDTAPAPGPDQWTGITDSADSYRHVRAHGTFINDKTTYIQASTGMGMGYWVLTPLKSDDGYTVLVNRGFVPSPHQERQVTSDVMVTGLVRMSEPKGRVLRANKPAEDRWYSRDVEAIGAARGLSQVAPYFIDADATRSPGQWPAGGLTVISFPNNHLQYALTWFGMALALGIGVIAAERHTRRQA